MSPISIRHASNRKVTLAVSILIATLAVVNLYYNISLGGLFYYYTTEIAIDLGLLLFIVLFSISYSMGHFLLFKFVGPLASHMKRSHFLTLTYKIVVIAQYSMLVLILIITIQMIFSSQYSVGLFIAVALIGFSVAAFIIGYLSIKFLSWYRSNRNFVILIYASSFILLAAGLTGVVVMAGGNVLLEKDPQSSIRPMLNDYSPEKRESDSAKESELWNIVVMPSRVAFILYWVANVILLRNYSNKVGRAKFWAIVSLPLVGFVILNLIVILSTLIIGTSPFGLVFLTVTRIIIVLVMLMSGIFFAIMFLTMGRAMKKAGQAHIQNYLKCSAYGTVIFVIALTIHVGTLLYPPTVLISFSFAGMSSYLISFGFYSLAISVSQDIKLRKSIRNFVISEAKLFDNIGMAQMQLQLEQRVTKIVKEQEEELENTTEIKPSLTEDDIKSYMKEVIQEVKASRR